MTKSFMLFPILCCLITLLVAPGIVAADTYVFPSDPNGVGAYRDFSIFGENTLMVAGTTNAVILPDPDQVQYKPTTATSPGYITAPWADWPNAPSEQHTYVVNLPSPIGGRLPEVPGLHPANDAIPGLLVLSNAPNLQLPTAWHQADGLGWLDQGFLSQVNAIVAFVPGCSTAVVYENQGTVPEPSLLFLLGPGIIALMGTRRLIKK